MAARSSLGQHSSGNGQPLLSDEFLRRIFSIVAMGEGWNGGRESRIAPATAAAAVRVASASLEFAPEPSVGPSPDGAVLLEWHLKPELDFEAYVRTASPNAYEVVISRAGEVSDATPATTDELLALLEACAAA